MGSELQADHLSPSQLVSKLPYSWQKGNSCSFSRLSEHRPPGRGGGVGGGGSAGREGGQLRPRPPRQQGAPPRSAGGQRGGPAPRSAARARACRACSGLPGRGRHGQASAEPGLLVGALPGPSSRPAGVGHSAPAGRRPLEAAEVTREK